MAFKDYTLEPDDIKKRQIQAMAGGGGIQIDEETGVLYNVYSLDFTTLDGIQHKFLLDEDVARTLCSHLFVYGGGLMAAREGNAKDGHTDTA